MYYLSPMYVYTHTYIKESHTTHQEGRVCVVLQYCLCEYNVLYKVVY